MYDWTSVKKVLKKRKEKKWKKKLKLKIEWRLSSSDDHQSIKIVIM